MKVINKEKQIIQQLNTDLNLNLTNPTLKQVITKVKELINKPGTTSTVITDNQAEVLAKENQKLQQNYDSRFDVSRADYFQRDEYYSCAGRP